VLPRLVGAEFRLCRAAFIARVVRCVRLIGHLRGGGGWDRTHNTHKHHPQQTPGASMADPTTPEDAILMADDALFNMLKEERPGGKTSRHLSGTERRWLHRVNNMRSKHGHREQVKAHCARRLGVTKRTVENYKNDAGKTPAVTIEQKQKAALQALKLSKDDTAQVLHCIKHYPTWSSYNVRLFLRQRMNIYIAKESFRKLRQLYACKRTQK
jgi:hypothetical protein